MRGGIILTRRKAMKRMKRGEKSKRESSPGVKNKKKTGPRIKKDSTEETKKTEFAASDKGSAIRNK